ncbi:hypothetical protein HDV01_005678 [Terramyces sp. JEL0728]|nr:hypothetical protein HDV01_005678 [Terramyces sp. JEL0728]
MKKVTVPKCTTNDYAFLNDAKGFYKPTFKLENKENKDAYNRIFKGKKPLSKEECESEFKEYRETHDSNRDLLNQERVNQLNACFCNVIESMTTYKELIAEIQNEYMLVLGAVLLKEQEMVFLRNKIQSGLGSLATPKQLSDQQKKLAFLKAKYERCQIVRQYYLDEIDNNKVKFAANVAALYDLELEKWKLKKRNDMLQLGRWHFTKDWLAERKANDPELQKILESMDKRYDQFRKLMIEDEELTMHDFDSIELKKMKQYVDDQKRNCKNLQKEIEDYTGREERLRAKINKVKSKIKDVEDIMIPFGVDLLDGEQDENSRGERSSIHRYSRKSVQRRNTTAELKPPIKDIMRRPSLMAPNSSKRMSISQPWRRMSLAAMSNRGSISETAKTSTSMKTDLETVPQSKKNSADNIVLQSRRTSIIISGPNYFRGNMKTHQQISSELNVMFDEVIGLKPAPENIPE